MTYLQAKFRTSGSNGATIMGIKLKTKYHDSHVVFLSHTKIALTKVTYFSMTTENFRTSH